MYTLSYYKNLYLNVVGNGIVMLNSDCIPAFISLQLQKINQFVRNVILATILATVASVIFNNYRD